MDRPNRARRLPPAAVLREWLGREWKALLLVLGLAALIFALGRYAFAPSPHESRVETGVIVRFGLIDGKWGGRPLVLVRTAHGRVRQLMVARSVLRGCRRGDRIALIRRGNRLSVHPAGCRRER